MCYSTDGYHLPKDIPDECNMVFICEKFEGKVFNNLKQKGFRLVCNVVMHTFILQCLVGY